MTPLEWYTPFISIDVTLLEKVLRTIVVYLGIAILLRVAGKRLLAQMNSLDLIVILLLSNVVQNAIIGPDNSVLGAMIGAVVLIGFDLVIDRLADRVPIINQLLVGPDTEVIRNGRKDARVLARLGINDHELNRALRRQGVHHVNEVEHAVLDPSGELLVEPMPMTPPASKADLAAAVAELKALIQAQQR